MTIINADNTPACDILNINSVHDYSIQGAAGAKSILWTVRVRASNSASTQNGAGISVTVDSKAETLAITIVDFQAISGTFTATGSLRPDNDNIMDWVNKQSPDIDWKPTDRNMTEFRSVLDFEQYPSENDLASTLILLRGRFEQMLRAVILPNMVPVNWSVLRNPDDAQAIRTPNLPILEGMAQTPAQAKLYQSATGSFLVCAQAKCACGQRHTARFARLVLLEITDLKDSTSVDQKYFPMNADAGISFDRSRNDASVEIATDAITLNASIRVLSGGPQASLLLAHESDVLSALWMNNMRENPMGQDHLAEYDDGRTIKDFWTRLPAQAYREGVPYNRIPTDLTRPGDIGKNLLLQPPVLDQTDNIKRVLDLSLSNCSATFSPARNNGLGYEVLVKAVDLPNQPMPCFWLNSTELLPNGFQTKTATDKNFPLRTLTMYQSHLTSLVFNTKSAPWIIGAACKISWSITGKWEVQYTPDGSGRLTFHAAAEDPSMMPKVGREATVNLLRGDDGLVEANKTDLEVCAPGTLMHIGRVLLTQ